jgi:hypothetical protein
LNRERLQVESINPDPPIRNCSSSKQHPPIRKGEGRIGWGRRAEPNQLSLNPVSRTMNRE